MEEINKNQGIYKITNIVDGKFYIGSSKNIRRRWQRHKTDLRNNYHCNSHLQNAWNKYGESSFKFKVIKLVNDKDLLLEREQFYIDSLDCCNRNIGYNLNTNAAGGGSAKGERNYWYNKGYLRRGKLNNFYGIKHTEETKQVMRENKLGKRQTKNTEIKYLKQ